MLEERGSGGRGGGGGGGGRNRHLCVHREKSVGCRLCSIWTSPRIHERRLRVGPAGPARTREIIRDTQSSTLKQQEAKPP